MVVLKRVALFMVKSCHLEEVEGFYVAGSHVRKGFCLLSSVHYKGFDI